MSITFTDENIAKLFGAQDAESESIERLKEYFLKKRHILKRNVGFKSTCFSRAQRDR